MKTLLYIFLLIPSLSYCQKVSSTPHGTLIYALICRDGVLIAADSRASFTIAYKDSTTGKSKELIYAYVDSNQKIFQISNYKIGVSGFSMLGKYTWPTLLEKFNKKMKDTSAIEETFIKFHLFLNNEMNLPDSLIFGENQYIIAGYDKGLPIIYAIGNDGARIREGRMGGMVQSNKDFKGYINKNNVPDLNCFKAALALDDAFAKFSRDNNDIGIGGPIMKIQITKENWFNEISYFNPVKNEGYNQYANDILNQKIKVVYLYEWSQKKLRDMLLGELYNQK